jgi:hypothetical protein
VAFADDYANYLQLFNLMQQYPDFLGVPNADQVTLMQAYATAVYAMDQYEAAGLASTDLSRNMFIPTAAAGVSVPSSALGPVINPGIQSNYNPTTGQAVPPGYQPPPTVNTAPNQPPQSGVVYGGNIPPAPVGSAGVSLDWSQVLFWGGLGWLAYRALRKG